MAASFFGRKDSERPSIRALARSAKQAGDPRQAAALYVQAGRIALDAGEERRAVSLFEKALERHPLDVAASDGLQSVFRARGELKKLYAEQERRVAVLVAMKGDARALARAHAALARTNEELGRVDEALESYVHAFELDPSQVDVAHQARRLATVEGKWEHVCALLEQEIAVVADRRELGKLLCELAIVRRERLGDVHEATALIERAVERNPDDADLHQELADTLLARAEQTEDLDHAASDRNRAADVLCSMVDLVPREQQLEHIEAALDAAPEHLGALELLERMFPSDRERLIDRWGKHVEAFPDGPMADDLRVRLCEAHRDAGRPEEAVRWLEPLARQGRLEHALTLVELHVEVGRPGDARTWAALAIERAPAARKLEVRRSLFERLRAADPDQAYVYARQILIDAPNDAHALDHASRVCETREDWEALDDLLTEVASRPEVGAAQRLELLRRVATVREERRRDLPGALDAWRLVEELSGGADAGHARDQRVRLAEATEAWDEVVELVDERVRNSRGRDERIGLLRELARVHRDERDDPERAALVLLSILELDGDDALAELCDALGAAGPRSKAVPEVTASAGQAPPSRAAAVFRMLGRLHDGWGEATEAFDAWTHVRAVHEDDPEAFERLVALAVALGHHRHALELLEHRLARASGTEAVGLQRKIAVVAGDHLGDFDRAADALTIALEATPDDRDIAVDLCTALRRAGRYGEESVVLRVLAASAPDAAARLDALERLHRVLAFELRDPEEAFRTWRQMAAAAEDVAILERLAGEARELDDPARLEVAVARLRSVESRPDRRRALALEHAELLAKKLGRPADARAALEQSAAAEGRTHLPILSALEALCAELGDDRALARVLEQQVPVVRPSSLGALLHRLADLYEGPLGDAQGAIRALVRWEKVRPDEIEPRLRLVPHLAADTDFEGLLTRVDRLIAIAPSDRERWVRIGADAVDGAPQDGDLAWFLTSLAERAASPDQRLWSIDRAADRFEAAGAAGPAFAASRTALELGGPVDRLLERADRLAPLAGKWEELDCLYERFVAQAPTPDARRSLALRHAELLAEARSRTSEALDRLLRVSLDDLTAPDLLDSMESLAHRCGRLDDLLVAYQDRVTLVGSGDQAVLLTLRAARAAWRARRFDDVESFLGHAVALADGDAEQLDRVESFVDELGHATCERLVDVYRAAAGSAAPETAAQHLVRAARLLNAKLGTTDRAFELADEALSLAPTSEWLLDAVEKLAVDGGRVERLDARLETMIAETMSDAVAAALLRRRGHILHAHLDKPSEAADAYRRLWALRPDDPKVLSRLRICLIETGRIQELISATERALARRTDRAQRLQLMRDIAELWEEVHNSWEALDAWKRVLSDAPDDARAAEAVARLERAQKRGTGAT